MLFKDSCLQITTLGSPVDPEVQATRTGLSGVMLISGFCDEQAAIFSRSRSTDTNGQPACENLSVSPCRVITMAAPEYFTRSESRASGWLGSRNTTAAPAFAIAICATR